MRSSSAGPVRLVEDCAINPSAIRDSRWGKARHNAKERKQDSHHQPVCKNDQHVVGEAQCHADQVQYHLLGESQPTLSFLLVTASSTVRLAPPRLDLGLPYLYRVVQGLRVVAVSLRLVLDGALLRRWSLIPLSYPHTLRRLRTSGIVLWKPFICFLVSFISFLTSLFHVMKVFLDLVTSRASRIKL